MAFYIRYYEDEVLVPKAEDILPFLESLGKLTDDELTLIKNNVQQLKAGTNRVYLNSNKTRYLLVIGTAQTSLDDFRNKSKIRNKQQDAKPAAEQAPAPAPAATDATPTVELSDKPATDTTDDEWNVFVLSFSKMVNDKMQPFQFRARVRKATLQSAYQRMSEYLQEKYGPNCEVPALAPDTCWME